MDVRDFDFNLPPELVAQEPPPDRGASRLLVMDRTTGALTHAHITAVANFLKRGDLVVVNDTRVFPARLLGRRVPSRGAVECLLLARVGLGSDLDFRVLSEKRENRDLTPTTQMWEALVHPGQKLKPGTRVIFDGVHTIHGEVLERRFFGRRLVRLWTEDGTAVDTAVDAIGHMPLPPYIKRDDRDADRDRYQTVFAQNRGSIAAPTAGLHFNAAVLEALAARGIDVASITLHVGYGTFQPVRVERVEDHRLESEHYTISEATAAAIARTRAAGGRVIAVGTTTTRTLEAVALAHGGSVVEGEGATDLFIYPGFEFRIVSGLLTNFHVPRSSLLMLVSAFAGREHVRTAYDAAIAARYRFYSYGDAMFVI